MRAKKIAVVGDECVACGACVKVCPLDAMEIYRGVIATVDPARCVGCGKCAVACPAGVIAITEREESGYEEKTLV
jgi:ferredoxin